jgi:hypothetical protein
MVLAPGRQTWLLGLRELRDPAIELRERLRQLLLPRLVSGELELPRRLGTGQAAGLQLTRELRITPPDSLLAPAFLLFPFLHPFGKAGFRVDESFSGITHADFVSDVCGGP